MSDNAYRFTTTIRRIFFSGEQKQKTFILCAAARLAPGQSLAASDDKKVFWFYSSEKNAFLSGL
jgi:hypothetical protein